MFKLTAIIMAGNEEPVIRKALESVKDFDEIIFVNTGATDKTPEICGEYGAKEISFPWIDDFSAPRNAGIESATGDWIYSIDADQVLKSSIDEVRRTVEKLEEGGFNCGEVWTINSHWRTVLFKRDPKIRWVGKIHEYLDGVNPDKTGLVRFRGRSALPRDPERNLKLLLQEPDNERTTFYIAREYYEMGRYSEAMPFFMKYLDIKGTTSLYRSCAFYNAARTAFHLGENNLAAELAFGAIRLNPNYKNPIRLLKEIDWKGCGHVWDSMLSVATNKDILFQN